MPKECPFCGSKYTHTYCDKWDGTENWRIECGECGALGPGEDTEQKAIDGWNNRHGKAVRDGRN